MLDSRARNSESFYCASCSLCTRKCNYQWSARVAIFTLIRNCVCHLQTQVMLDQLADLQGKVSSIKVNTVNLWSVSNLIPMFYFLFFRKKCYARLTRVFGVRYAYIFLICFQFFRASPFWNCTFFGIQFLFFFLWTISKLLGYLSCMHYYKLHLTSTTPIIMTNGLCSWKKATMLLIKFGSLVRIC